jgi:3-hydroxyacyl-CoA dehydrogenase/enoyl-CoA hydratase/3-hydroxybutyryl-CoA epimerase
MNPYVNITLDASGVAIIALNSTDTRLNVLSTPFMEALHTTLDSLSLSSGVLAGVICSTKPEGFIAGADLQELAKLRTAENGYEKSRKGQLIFQKLAQLPFPTVAAINGHCMGGGTELALACDFRLAATESARISLPEIRLGLFPGWGGTQRLPRLIGLRSALDMILTGRSYSAYQAWRCALVDKVVPDLILNRYAVEFAQEIARYGARKYVASRRKKTRSMLSALLENNPLGRFFILSLARQQVLKRTGKNYPAPFMALKVLQWGLSKPLTEGLMVEARGFARLIPTPEHQNLLRVFQLSQRHRKHPFQTFSHGLDFPCKIGLVGAGVMGGGIAGLLADKNFRVRMKDIRRSMILGGLMTVTSLLDDAVRRHRISRLEKDRKLENIAATLSYEGFSRADIVIEAVAEQMAVKQKVLGEIEGIVSKDAVFASNTSALSISELQSKARFPGRVCGMHFFNPVHRMPLVEVIQGKQTDDRTLAIVYDLSGRLEKIPVIVQDSPGFLVNRLLGVYINEACILAQEGCDILSIDRLVETFGMPMGPFRLMDEVGIDIADDVGIILSKSFEHRFTPGLLLKHIRNQGFLGKKSGKGFYRYRNGRKKGINPHILQVLPGRRKQMPPEVLERMMFLMVNEAACCIRQGIVSGPEDVDTAMVFGTGFPPFRGGLCRWADTIGLGVIAEALEKFKKDLGCRFSPDPFLTSEVSFYALKQGTG